MQLNAIKIMERRARQNPKSFSLAQGIPSRLTDEKLHDAACAAIRSGKCDTYSDPQGLTELRTKLSQHLKSWDMNYEPSEIIVTAGAMEALSATLHTVVSQQKPEVIVPTPVYGAYFKLVEAAGGMATQIVLNERQDWSLSADEIISAISPRTAAILLCHPNNPTGTVYPEQTLKLILEAARVNDIPVIIDEVYRNMVYDDAAFYSPATDLRYKDVVIRIMSFSKDFSLTGWRIGYVHASQRRIDSILGVHDTLVNCAPVIAQHIAMRAVDEFERITGQNRLFYSIQRDFVVNELKKLDSRVQFSVPSAGYCVFVRIQGIDDSNEFALKLARNGVAVVPGSAFGMGGEGCIRICFGRDIKTLASGMEILASTVSDILLGI